MNLPIFLTAVRVFLIPFFIFFFYQPSPVGPMISAMIFIVASLTDILDGYLARLRSEVTTLGKILDPIADKLLIVSALILLVGEKQIPAWMAIVIVGREFVVTGFRAVAASSGVVIAAEKTGKYKVFLQIVAILLILIDSPPFSSRSAGLFLLSISMILAIVSAVQYFIKFGGQIRDH